MHVPEEMVQTAIRAGWEGPFPSADDALTEPVTRALQVVLPMVRERLLDEADKSAERALNDYGNERDWQKLRAYEMAPLAVVTAFDAAFPEENS